MERRVRGIALLGWAALSLALLGGCRHAYRVEERETPLHVWIVAPEIGARQGSVDALVYVGSHKVVDGTVSFPPGVSTVILPTIHLKAGRRLVQAVLDRGTLTASETLDVGGESWIQIVVSGRTVRIVHTEEQPLLAR